MHEILLVTYMSDNFGSSAESKREKWIDWMGYFSGTGKD